MTLSCVLLFNLPTAHSECVFLPCGSYDYEEDPNCVGEYVCDEEPADDPPPPPVDDDTTEDEEEEEDTTYHSDDNDPDIDDADQPSPAGIGPNPEQVNEAICQENCTAHTSSDTVIDRDSCHSAIIEKCIDATIQIASSDDDPAVFSDDEMSLVDAPLDGQNTDGDPVTLASGGLYINQTDLSFPGPVRPLEFRRSYHSQSDERSALGSNWTHNYDVRLIPVEKDSAPAWAPPGCWSDGARCLLYKANGSTTLFFKPYTKDFYLSAFSSGATITELSSGGWEMKEPNGLKRIFDERGYLISEQDRFGNGFEIEYEATPLFQLYQRYCNGSGFWALYDPRICGVLEYIFEKKPGSWQTWGPYDQDHLYTKRCYSIPHFNNMGHEGYDWINQQKFTITWERYESCWEDPTQCGWCAEGLFETPSLATQLAVLPCNPDLMRAEIRTDIGFWPPDPNAPIIFFYGYCFFLNDADPVEPWHVKSTWNYVPTGILSKHYYYGLRLKTDSEIEASECAQLGWDRYGGLPPQPRPLDMDEWITAGDDLLYHVPTLPNESRYALYYDVYYESLSPEQQELLPPAFPSGLLDLLDQLVFLLDQGSIDLAAVGKPHGHYRTPESPTGDHRQRPIRVTDDLGRSLEFEYYDASVAESEAWSGLLKAVHGPASSHLEFAYDRPNQYPKLLNEWFLVDVKRRDDNSIAGDPIARAKLTDGSGLDAKQITYTYGWPDNYGYDNDHTYYSHLQPLWHDFMEFGKDGFASKEVQAYMSSQADNIYKVERNRHLPQYRQVEMQNRYTMDPKDRMLLDRVIRQASNGLSVFDANNPAYVFEYHTGYPIASNLPSAIFQKYKLEPGSFVTATFKQQLFDWIGPELQPEYGVKLIDYHPVIEAVDEIQLTRLTCQQLAREEKRQLLPNVAPISLFSFVGLRDRVHKNLHRLCSWTKTIDQDGHVRWRGFNYRGQMLVDAVHEVDGNYFIFQENLFNEDGRLIEARRPTTSTQVAWNPENGYTRYDYQGFNDISATQWRSRLNPVRIVEVPREGVDYHWTLADGNITTLGQLTRMSYETSYNQIASLESGFINTDHEDQIDYELRWGFDALCPAGIVSFCQQNPRSNPCRKKWPQVMVAQNPTNPATKRVTRFRWAPHGHLARLHEDGGRSISLTYGGLSNDNRGFPTEVRKTRFDADYGDFMPGSSCTSYGPYQWLLNDNCGLRDSKSLHTKLRDLLEASTDPELSSVINLKYSIIGHPEWRMRDGHATTYIRDIDGRILRQTTPDQNVTEILYAPEGWPTRFSSSAPNQDEIYQLHLAYNPQGQVTRQCVALESGACTGFEASTAGNENYLLIFNPSRQIAAFKYSPEGLLTEEFYASALKVQYEYNSRRLRTRQKVIDPDSPNSEIGFCHTLDGDIRRIVYELDRDSICQQTQGEEFFGDYAMPSCAPAGNADNSTAFQESFGYDGFGRLLRHTDIRQTQHQFAYSSRDQRTREIRGRETCGPISQQYYAYDDHNQLRKKINNDIITTEIDHGPWGRSARILTTGEDPSFLITDDEGNSLWKRDAAGTESLSAWNNGERLHIHGTVLPGETPIVRQVLTEGDLHFLPVKQTLFASDSTGDTALSQVTQWTRQAAGFVTEKELPHGELIRYTKHNWLGWPEEIYQQEACTEYRYDRTGKILQLTDPTGQISHYRYNANGQLREEKMPGEPNAREYSYDALQRQLKYEQANGTIITFHYDGRNDLRELRLANGDLLTKQQFDQLGRPTYQNEYSQVLGQPYTVSQHFEYDALGRLKLEETHYLNEGLKPFKVQHDWKLVDEHWTRRTIYPSGLTLDVAFDRGGRIATLSAPNTEMTLNWQGQVYRGRQYANGIQETLNFDPLGRTIERRVFKEAPTNLFHEALIRERSGQIGSRLHSFQNTSGSPSKPTWQGFLYNDRNYLDQIWSKANADPPTQSIPQGKLTPEDIIGIGEELQAKHIVYTRDAIGSLQQITDKTTEQTLWQLTAPRDQGHELKTVSIAGTTVHVGHNTNGQVDRIGNQQLNFDAKGRLKAIHENGELVESYAYTARGQLAAAHRGPTANRSFLVHAGAQLIGAYRNNDDTHWEAIWGPTSRSLLKWHNNEGKWFIPVVDYRNSVVATINQEEAQLSQQTVAYDAQGRAQINVGDTVACEDPVAGPNCSLPADIPFAFTSSWQSPVSGLTYMGHRWYSPRLAEFVSPDPLGYFDTYNTYAYARFDPINRWDPTGAASKGFLSTAWDVAGDVVSAAPGFGVDMVRDTILDKIPPSARRRHHRGDHFVARADGDVDRMYAQLDKQRTRGVTAVIRELEFGANTTSDVIGAIPSPPTKGATVAKPILKAAAKPSFWKRFLSKGSKSAAKSLDEGSDEALKTARKACKGASCFCFAPGTQVLMADGSTQAIESIQVGDWVLADDPGDDAPSAAYEVLETHETATYRLISIEIDDGDGIPDGTIKATGRHPFWSPDQGWIYAEDLTAGDLLFNEAGELAYVHATWPESIDTPTYNLSVAGPESYFVVAGDTAVLVHNVDPWDIQFSQDSIDPHFRNDPEVPARWRGRPISEAVDAARKSGKLPEGLTLNAMKVNDRWVTLNNRTLYIAREANLPQVHPVDAGPSGTNQLNRLLKEADLTGPIDEAEVRCP